MTNAAETAISLTPQETRALFIRLKRAESGIPAAGTGLSPIEQAFLLRIEKKLYQNLSVQEAESLMKEIAGSR
jgi:hypothetical protein